MTFYDSVFPIILLYCQQMRKDNKDVFSSVWPTKINDRSSGFYWHWQLLEDSDMIAEHFRSHDQLDGDDQIIIDRMVTEITLRMPNYTSYLDSECLPGKKSHISCFDLAAYEPDSTTYQATLVHHFIHDDNSSQELYVVATDLTQAVTPFVMHLVQCYEPSSGLLHSQQFTSSSNELCMYKDSELAYELVQYYGNSAHPVTLLGDREDRIRAFKRQLNCTIPRAIARRWYWGSPEIGVPAPENLTKALGTAVLTYATKQLDDELPLNSH